MKAVFADTSYYLALVNPKDEAHARAKIFGADYDGHIFTTEYVLIELGNGLSKGSARSIFVALYDSILLDAQTTVIAASSRDLERAVSLYRSRLDKEWSLVDCTSIVAMQQLDLQDALSTDHHFRQAGFSVLLSTH